MVSQSCRTGRSECSIQIGCVPGVWQRVPQDTVEAYAWSGLATGSAESAPKLHDQLLREMTPEQIVAAYRRAKELRTEIETKLKNTGSKYIWSGSIPANPDLK